jgi:D-alanyl-D-alanine dipeptidase
MQLVEQKRLDLDQPVSRYLPDFQPHNPFGTPITVRMLLTHRSGLVREPPFGGLTDTVPNSLAGAVASLNQSTLVYRPGTHTKYSNAAVGVLGRLIERVTGDSFASYERTHVLAALGMTRSDFTPRADLMPALARGVIWSSDGREEPGPLFQFGIASAANLYTTVIDLGHFMSALFAGGRSPRSAVIKPATLRAMYQPQFATGGRAPFGLGFELGTLDGQPTVGHGGITYGYATTLLALPDAKLGVVVVSTRFWTNDLTDRLARQALRLMLAARQHAPLPEPDHPVPVPVELARTLEGRYGTGAGAVELDLRHNRLYATWFAAGPRSAVRMLGDTLISDDRASFGRRLVIAGNRLVSGRDTLTRVNQLQPAPLPAQWAGLLGEYGTAYNPVIVLERDGALTVQRAQIVFYPLQPIAGDTFQFPPFGLNDGERLVFQRDSSGSASGVIMGAQYLPRRHIEPDAGNVYHIKPLHPVEELRREALAASPPTDTTQTRPADLVELTTLDSTIHLDIRYATTRNFMGAAFYSAPRAFLQRPAAEALLRVIARLKPQGYGLLIHDAYRPWYVTKMFWDASPTPDRVFVANPYPGSRHNRGSAVDLSMYDLATGQPVSMVSTYDEFSPRAYAEYPGGTSLERWHREVLRQAMEAEGFNVIQAEWWHFDYRDWKQYPVLNLTFEQIHP